MLNENLNPTNWKAKLDVMDAIDGESALDKNASWHQLYQRLNEKKRSRIAIGYWLAAASLLVAMVTTVFFYMQKPLPQSESANITLKEKTVEKDKVSEGNHSQIIPDPPVITDNHELRSNENVVKIEQRKKTEIIIPEIRVGDTVSKIIDVSASIAQKPLKDSTIQIVAIIPSKKKLKVVHINTIDEPVRVPQFIVRGSGKSFFQLSFGDQQVMESPVNSKNKNPSLFKIKTSLN